MISQHRPPSIHDGFQALWQLTPPSRLAIWDQLLTKLAEFDRELQETPRAPRAEGTSVLLQPFVRQH